MLARRAKWLGAQKTGCNEFSCAQKAEPKRIFLSIGRSGQKAEYQQSLGGFSGRKAQKEIVEFAFLSLAAFLILTLVSLTFSKITDGIGDAEKRNSLASISSELALAISNAESLADKNPASNFTIFLDFPRELAGLQYSLAFSRADDPSCKIGNGPPGCVRAIAGGSVVYYPIRVSRDVTGEIFGSTGAKAAVTYNSNERGKLSLSLK